MCGILGLLHNAEISPELFEKLLHKLDHRGPDDFGYEINNKVGIGNTRLSIIDLSENGKQPHYANNKNIAVVLNGEIYNYLELKNQYLTEYTFDSDTDTEVIAKLYAKFGEKAFSMLDGMFTVALHDRKKNVLLLIRDKLGIKPLYYTFFDNSFIFASEPKGILEYPGFKTSLNHNAILSYFQFRYVVGTETFFSNIYKLPEASIMKIQYNLQYEIAEYWHLTIPNKPMEISFNEAKEKVRALFLKAVKKRLISDVPLGAFLSGGLDSSLVVLAMKELGHSPIRTYSISVEADPFAEFKYAKIIAEQVQSIHKEIEISQKNYFNDLEEMLTYRDEPLGVPNEVLLMKLSEILKQDITVVLSGEGADEIFGGYGRIFRSAEDFTKIKWMHKLPFGKYIFRDIYRIYGNTQFKELKDLFLWHYRYTSDATLQAVFTHQTYTTHKDYALDLFSTAFNKVKHLPPSMQFMYVFEMLHLPNLLRRLDATTMARSVEGRVPFVDTDLVDFTLQLHPKIKMKWKSPITKLKGIFKSGQSISENYDITKYILREAYADLLPEEITKRKKVGFPVPLNTWFNDEKVDQLIQTIITGPIMNYNIIEKEDFITWVNDIKNNLSVKQGIQLWMFYNINSWLNQYMKYLT